LRYCLNLAPQHSRANAGYAPNRSLNVSLLNSRARLIDGKPASDIGVLRGATGTTNWTRYEIELPVPAEAHNINFGLLFDGTGTAWFHSLRVELNGVPYFNPQVEFDFESPTPKGFFAGDNMHTNRYKVGLDDTTAFTPTESEDAVNRQS
jgi:hypothetical protein